MKTVTKEAQKRLIDAFSKVPKTTTVYEFECEMKNKHSNVILNEKENKIKTNNMYYNTTNLVSMKLKEAILNAETQNEKIKVFFQSKPNELFTPCEVLKCVFDNKIPITSVRRSMTNLTNSHVLEKTNAQKIGIYGKVNYCWKLKK